MEDFRIEGPRNSERMRTLVHRGAHNARRVLPGSLHPPGRRERELVCKHQAALLLDVSAEVLGHSQSSRDHSLTTSCTAESGTATFRTRASDHRQFGISEIKFFNHITEEYVRSRTALMTECLSRLGVHYRRRHSEHDIYVVTPW